MTNTKYFVIIITCNLLGSLIYGQTLSEKVALKACESFDSIDNFQVLQDSIQPSIINAMAKVMMEGTPEEQKKLSTVEGMRGTINESIELLPGYCYTVRRLIIEDKRSRFYKMSDNPKANAHFDEGNEYMERGDYKNAVVEFKSAVEYDKNFIYAIDHLAISYRHLEDYKAAINYYEKSLEIFPEGEVALLNLAVSYTFLEDYPNAMKSYDQFRYLYPDNPEGYFGLAKLQFVNEDYENALDNLFTAHRMYVLTNSDYVEDSELLMGLMFNKLTELNMTDLIKEKAKEHNISIDE